MSDELHHVFVYGTLQPGEPRWPLLEPFLEGDALPAQVIGVLFDTGRGYPAAVFDLPDGAPIPGTLVPIDPAKLERAIHLLDEVEGTGYGLYERVEVTTTDGQRAWAYSWQEDTAGLTAIPSWPST